MKKAIVFDLDGTLADSSGCIVKAAHFTSEQMALRPVSDDSIRAKIGQPLGPMLTDLFGLKASEVETAVQIYSDAYRRLAATEERLFEGSLDLIHRLRDAGFQLAIATGKSQHGAEHATRRLGIDVLFDSIHGILPGTPGKPDPAVLKRAMEALGVQAAECLMVGDTSFDLDLAHQIGVSTVAVTWGVHADDTLRARHPKYLVESFAALQKVLLDHFSHTSWTGALWR